MIAAAAWLLSVVPNSVIRYKITKHNNGIILRYGIAVKRLHN
jgi:hypothetical protein